MLTLSTNNLIDKVNQKNAMPDIEIARLTDRFVRRIQAALNATAPSFDTHKLGPAGGMLLMTLEECEPISVLGLSQQMARDKGQITRAVQSLEQKGLIERSNDPNDARVVMLSLSALGREAVGEIQKAVAMVLDEVLAPLDDQEQRVLRDFLSRI